MYKKLAVFCLGLLLFTSAKQLLAQKAKHAVARKNITKTVKEFGQLKTTRTTTYNISFTLPKGTKNYQMPFETTEPAGRYRFQAMWNPRKRIAVEVLLPSGGRGRLIKRLKNLPGENFINVKDINLSKNNKGMKAAIRATNTSSSTISGEISIEFMPLSEVAQNVENLNLKHDKLAERQRERINSLEKRLAAIERQLKTLTVKFNRMVKKLAKQK